jgi:hypothetical protein
MKAYDRQSSFSTNEIKLNRNGARLVTTILGLRS